MPNIWLNGTKFRVTRFTNLKIKNMKYTKFEYLPGHSQHEDLKSLQLPFIEAPDKIGYFFLDGSFDAHLFFTNATYRDDLSGIPYSPSLYNIAISDPKKRIRDQSMRFDLVLKNPKKFVKKVRAYQWRILKNELTKKEKGDIEAIELTESASLLKSNSIYCDQVRKLNGKIKGEKNGFSVEFEMINGLLEINKVSLDCSNVDPLVALSVARVLNSSAVKSQK